jgi:transmembrane sensor
MTLQEVLDIIEKISYRPKIHFKMQHHQLLVN